MALPALVAGYYLTRPRPQRHEPGVSPQGLTDRLALRLPPDAPDPRFVDVAGPAGLDVRSFNGERSSQLPEDMGPGAAWGDFDNDGDEDLFLVAAGAALSRPAAERAPSILFENLGDGTFRRAADFPETRIVGMGAAWADYDGDGWLDLAVSGYRELILFRNERGRLRRDPRFAAPDGFWAGLAWGDFDNDRDLDLYVCGYVRYREDGPAPAAASRQYGREVPYTLNPSSYPPERNLLLRNRGDGTFVESGAELGVDNPQGRSLSAVWRDFDDDGWLDLYVANDVSDNAFFLNRGGRFVESSHAAWVADYRGAMGVAAGDWNNDGDEDFFVTHWLAQENALYDSLLGDRAPAPTADAGSGAVVRSPAGAGAGREVAVRFMDIADQRGLGQVALRVVGWGTEFADLDADGWLDLVVANGSTLEAGGPPPRLEPQRPFLFWSRRGEAFHDLAPLVPALAGPQVGRGLAAADYDGDGDLDVVILRHGEEPLLLRNDVGGGSWLKLRLRSRPARPGSAHGRGEGARVFVDVAGRRLRRGVGGGGSYLSQGSLVVHFGLGAAESVDAVEVRWPGGGRDRHAGLAANAEWLLTEGDAKPGRFVRDAGRPPGRGTGEAAGAEERRRVEAFWEAQRAAIRAFKVDRDPGRAAGLFREALLLDPAHEDSLYYLGLARMQLEDVPGALSALEDLLRVNPASHRGLRQWALLRAGTAVSDGHLEAAREALERALAVNAEETGALLLLGEVDLLQGRLAQAENHLALACRTNPRAAVGFFLRGYVAWKRGDAPGAERLLAQAAAVGRDEKKPAGATAEGDVRRAMATEQTPLSGFFEAWDGRAGAPDRAFADLDEHLREKAARIGRGG